MGLKILYSDEEKIIIQVPPVIVDDERLELIIVKPDGIEYKTKKHYIRQIGKNKFETASKNRHKVQDFKDFLVLNKALEKIFRHVTCPEDAKKD